MPTTPFAAALLLALLAGCAATPPAAGVPPDRSESPTEEPKMQCDVSKAQWAIGQAFTPELMAKAQADAGTERARALKPGQMVTMEYHPSRLNIDLDEAGRITNVRCG